MFRNRHKYKLQNGDPSTNQADRHSWMLNIALENMLSKWLYYLNLEKQEKGIQFGLHTIMLLLLIAATCQCIVCI